MYFIVACFEENNKDGSSNKKFIANKYSSKEDALLAMQSIAPNAVECYITKALEHEINSDYSFSINENEINPLVNPLVERILRKSIENRNRNEE